MAVITKEEKMIEKWYDIPMFKEGSFTIESDVKAYKYKIYVTRIPTGWLVSKKDKTTPPCFIPYASMLY